MQAHAKKWAKAAAKVVFWMASPILIPLLVATLVVVARFMDGFPSMDAPPAN